MFPNNYTNLTKNTSPATPSAARTRSTEEPKPKFTDYIQSTYQMLSLPKRQNPTGERIVVVNNISMIEEPKTKLYYHKENMQDMLKSLILNPEEGERLPYDPKEQFIRKDLKRTDNVNFYITDKKGITPFVLKQTMINNAGQKFSIENQDNITAFTSFFDHSISDLQRVAIDKIGSQTVVNAVVEELTKSNADHNKNNAGMPLAGSKERNVEIHFCSETEDIKITSTFTYKPNEDSQIIAEECSKAKKVLPFQFTVEVAVNAKNEVRVAPLNINTGTE